MYLDLVFGLVVIIILITGVYVYYQNLPIKNSAPLRVQRCKKLQGQALVTIISDDESFKAALLMQHSARVCGYTGSIIFAHHNFNFASVPGVKMMPLDNLFDHASQIPLVAILQARVAKIVLVDSHCVWLDNPQKIMDSGVPLVQFADTPQQTPFDHTRRQIKEFIPYIISHNPITAGTADNYVSDTLVALDLNSNGLRCAIRHLSDLGWFHKEMFWVAAEMARVDYQIMDPGSLIIGRKTITGMLCGDHALIDDSGTLVLIKATDPGELSTFDSIGSGIVTLNGKCVADAQIFELSPNTREFINEILKSFHEPILNH